jgi:serine/threonine-protein kinase
LAAVLKTEPDVSAVTAELRPIVERCLRKDPRRRSRDIGDVRVALEEGMPVAATGGPCRSVLPWAVAGALGIVVVAAPWLV